MSELFASNLKAYRSMAGMTQTDLANSVGITRSAVNNYEAAKSEPSFDVLCKFAQVLGVEITDLVEKREVSDYIRRVQVTDEESALLQLFRNANPIYRGVAMDILKTHQEGQK